MWYELRLLIVIRSKYTMLMKQLWSTEKGAFSIPFILYKNTNRKRCFVCLYNVMYIENLKMWPITILETKCFNYFRMFSSEYFQKSLQHTFVYAIFHIYHICAKATIQWRFSIYYRFVSSLCKQYCSAEIPKTLASKPQLLFGLVWLFSVQLDFRSFQMNPHAEKFISFTMFFNFISCCWFLSVWNRWH